MSLKVALEGNAVYLFSSMTKNEYYNFFKEVKPFININYYLKIINMNSGQFSKFIHGDLHVISLDTLNILYDMILDDINNIIKKWL